MTLSVAIAALSLKSCPPRETQSQSSLGAGLLLTDQFSFCDCALLLNKNKNPNKRRGEPVLLGRTVQRPYTY